MTVDLSGGHVAADDLPLLAPPPIERYGENHAFWLFDERGEYGLMCCHLEAPAPVLDGSDRAPSWDSRRVAYGLTMPGDRVLTDFAVGEGTTTDVVVAAGFSFTCAEPFVRWTGHATGTPQSVTAKELFSGPAEGSRVDLALDTEMTMAFAPWVQGVFSPDTPERSEALRFISGDGGYRYEQLMRHETSFTVDGEQHSFAGVGLRTHRKGPRNTSAMQGHSWATAVFPSGRAFGYQAYPRSDGTTLWSEGWVSGADGPVGAALVEFPWLTSAEYSGEKFVIELDGPDGREHIEAETLAHSVMMGRGLAPTPGSFFMTHGMARYRWNGEEAVGLLERSTIVGPAFT